jgi:hypothetical protein
MRALQRNPEQRWRTARLMQLALEDFCLAHASAGSRLQLAQYVRDLFGAEQVLLRQRLAAGDFEEVSRTAMLPPPPPLETVESLEDMPTEIESDLGKPELLRDTEVDASAARARGTLPSQGMRRTWLLASLLGVAAAGVVMWLLGGQSLSGETASGTRGTGSLAAGDGSPAVAPAQDLVAAVPLDAHQPQAPDAALADAATVDAALPVEEVEEETPPPVTIKRDRRDRRDRERERRKEKAFLTIDVMPWGEVVLDGVKIGSTPIARRRIDPGRHTIAVIGRDEGYRLTWGFTVKPGEDHVEKRVLAKGKLTCDAEPRAEVFIGKRRLGTTPLAPVTLTEGTYQLRLVNPELKKEKTVSARIRAGQVTRLKEKL